MTPCFKMMVLALGVASISALPIGAKPPGLPTMPETEFKVLPLVAQEFFAEENNSTDIFVPLASWLPFKSASAAVSGPGSLLVTSSAVKWNLNCPLGFRVGCGSFFGAPGAAIVLAAERQERLAMLRLAAEVGEEQSEEPPIAGAERLTVMPREVRR